MGRGVSGVIPAQAGIHAFRCLFLWIPACAGMTGGCLKNSPTPQLAKIVFFEKVKE